MRTLIVAVAINYQKIVFQFFTFFSQEKEESAVSVTHVAAFCIYF